MPADTLFQQTGFMSSRHLARGRDSRVDSCYVLTTVVRQRRRVFEDPDHAACLLEALQFVERAGMSHSFAWVIMPDHLHWLVQLRSGTLARLMGTVKSRSSRHLGQQFGVDTPLWQPSYFDHAVRHEEALRRHALYILGNPIRVGLTSQLDEYPFAWCRWSMR
ncbi:REP-associated tyrosine transposase [Stenotrophomonas indicatrix]|uniref:REP-associated tyrosine transposase n=1 Tax=Stenotrophomonas indicatrix TaxID=2045451 RepID=UPI002006AE2E|nr:transposase [Stenotrophomonas indicatrix]